MDSNSSPPKSVMLVDDHPIVRKGIAVLINQEDDLFVSNEACSTSDALEQLDSSLPDIMIVDVSLHGASGLDLTKTIKDRYPRLPVLMLSMHDETIYAERALRAGARGYIMKQESPETVIEAIKTVLSGNIYVSNALSAKLLRNMVDGVRPVDTDLHGVDRLSDRELEVFEFIGRGYTTRKIAEALQLSIKTIETHRAHIKQKLKLKNATELVHRAYHWIETSAGAKA